MQALDTEDPPRLLTRQEVARMFCVSPETVTRWARRGWLTCVRVDPRGHHKYREDEVRALLRLPPADN